MSEENLFEEFPPVSTKEWEDVIERDLKGDNYKEKLKWETGEGVEALPFYRRGDRKKEDKALLPVDHRWDVCQNIFDQDITEANKAAKKAIEGGADALTFETEIQSVAGNIGSDMQGITVQSQEEFGDLLKGVPLEEVALHFNAGMLSPVFMGMLWNECQSREIAPAGVAGTFGYDPFSFILKHGRLPVPEQNLDEAIKQIIAGGQEFANMRTLQVDAGLYSDAGGTIQQELGYALAAGSEYLALAGGEAAPEIHFKFGISGNYFLEVAKLRAVRKLWPRIPEAYEAGDAEMVVHGTTAKWNKSKADPYTNIIRETTEAMAAAIGGCNAITVRPFDEIQKGPNEFSQRIARNTQLILKEEAWFDKVSDPAAGSWYIETLTDKIAEAAWNIFQEIEQEGGFLQSVKEGTLQTAVAESRRKRTAAAENEEQIFIGVNKYMAEEEAETGDVLPGKKTVSMNETEDGADIDTGNLIASVKEALKNEAAIGDIAPALFDAGKVQIERIGKYQVE